MSIEDSFDLQGYFIGKIPFDLDSNSRDFPSISRVPVVEQPVLRPPPPQPARSQPSSFSQRPQSESVRRSIAATTTANTFVVRSGLTPSAGLFTSATKTVPTAPSPFQFRGFNSNPAIRT